MELQQTKKNSKLYSCFRYYLNILNYKNSEINVTTSEYSKMTVFVIWVKKKNEKLKLHCCRETKQ